MEFGIAGAGWSGAVIAREMAELGHRCVVFETRDHVAGNCHTVRDPGSGVMVHEYGPHIFHTGDERVWNYINAHGEMQPYNHMVRTTVGGSVYLLPINLLTINQVFGETFGPAEAEAFIAEQADTSIGEPANFEEQALKFVGRTLYEKFFYGYTRKQWGCEPTELPASILKRLPVRFNYEASYFNHPWQAIPTDGYTPIVEHVLDHPNIEVRLSTGFDPASAADYDHVIWSGPIDAWFGHDDGRLGYRTLDFERIETGGDLLGCPVMNFGDYEVPYTRITEFKHFTPWESHDDTVAFREFSRASGPDDIPYYPVRLVDDKALLDRYLGRAEALSGVSFVGRLGTYRYLDMDVTIGEALGASDTMRACIDSDSLIPSFFVDPR